MKSVCEKCHQVKWKVATTSQSSKFQGAKVLFDGCFSLLHPIFGHNDASRRDFLFKDFQRNMGQVIEKRIRMMLQPFQNSFVYFTKTWKTWTAKPGNDSKEKEVREMLKMIFANIHLNRNDKTKSLWSQKLRHPLDNNFERQHLQY